MPGMDRLPFTLHNSLTQWVFSPFTLGVDVVLIALAVWYLRADWALAARGRRWPGVRTASFLGGLVMVALALQSSIATFSNWYFQSHVVQHVVLMVFAPALLALGAPSTLFLQTASRAAKQRWLHVLHSWPFAVLTNPLLVWFLYFGLMLVFFLTPLVGYAMQHMALMNLMNVIFLLGGTLFWWPMVGLDPIMHWKMNYPVRMFNLLLGSGLEAFLGIAIMAKAHSVAPMYTLASTHAGGALLWISVDVVNVAAFAPIFVQWARSEDRAAARFDARADREAARAPGSPGVPDDGTVVPARPRPLTLWEEAWLARRGVLPGYGVPPPDADVPAAAVHDDT